MYSLQASCVCFPSFHLWVLDKIQGLGCLMPRKLDTEFGDGQTLRHKSLFQKIVTGSFFCLNGYIAQDLRALQYSVGFTICRDVAQPSLIFQKEISLESASVVKQLLLITFEPSKPC